ncbi:hypothetical protein LTR94_018645 [Friedmanniomyces endolithicus]|nr:hypothetical protein LTR94_018645 [Friedmanniomyces endolithicus]
MDSRNAYITDTYPLELHSIKALFLQKRYRQVIQACRDILKTAGDGMRDYPLQQTFISFYIGVSHDELARLMHDYSQAKMPAFRQAEQFYNEAIVSLPLPGSILEVEGQAASLLPNDPFTESSPLDPNAYISPSPDEEYDPFNYSSPSLPNLTSSPPPSHYDTGNLPTRSTPVSSRETSSSDLESHSSFDQIMTPHKFLERDISHWQASTPYRRAWSATSPTECQASVPEEYLSGVAETHQTRLSNPSISCTAETAVQWEYDEYVQTPKDQYSARLGVSVEKLAELNQRGVVVLATFSRVTSWH